MNVDEIYELAVWVDREVSGKGVPQAYAALQAILQTNADSGSAAQPFEAERQAVIDAVRSVSLASLSAEQREILANERIAQHLGENGVQEVEEILVRNQLDIATAAQRFGTIVADFNRAVTHFQALESSLNGFVKRRSVESEGVLMRVVFTAEASINDVVDLKEWSEKWWRIARGVALANGNAVEDVKVASASHGSIIIELLLFAGLANVFLTLMNKALEGTEKILNIRLKLDEIRKLDIKEPSIEELLANAIKKARAEKIEEIAKALVDAEVLPKKLTADNRNTLVSSISELVGFLEKGGEVDFVLPASAGEPDDEPGGQAPVLAELQKKLTDQRALQERILALEARVQHLGEEA